MPQYYTPMSGPQDPAIDPATGLPSAWLKMSQARAPAAVEQPIQTGQAQPVPPIEIQGSPYAGAYGNEISPEDRAALATQDKYYQQLSDMAKSGIVQNERDINQFRQKETGMDLTGLMAMADAWAPEGTKSNLVAAYKAPMSEEQKTEKLMALQNQLQQRKEGMVKDSIEALKARLAATRGSREDARSARQEKSMDWQMFKAVGQDQKKLVGDATTFYNSFANTEAAIKPDADGTISAQRLQMSLSNFARLMGEKGVLTDYDITRQVGPTVDASLAKVQAYITSNPGQRVPAELASEVKAALADAKRTFAAGYRAKADNFRETVANNPGAPTANKQWLPKFIEETYKPLGMIEGQTKNTTPPGATQAAPAKPMTREEKIKALSR